MVQMFIQVAAGSCDRNISNESTLEFLETRPGSLPYPYPYGFITGTVGEDGCCVDCYLITRDKLSPSMTVECEPVGLLLQDEGGEMDHKVLAVIPGQTVTGEEELLRELQEFIYESFAKHLEIRIRVGPILPREEALRYIQEAGVRR